MSWIPATSKRFSSHLHVVGDDQVLGYDFPDVNGIWVERDNLLSRSGVEVETRRNDSRSSVFLEQQANGEMTLPRATSTWTAEKVDPWAKSAIADEAEQSSLVQIHLLWTILTCAKNHLFYHSCILIIFCFQSLTYN